MKDKLVYLIAGIAASVVFWSCRVMLYDAFELDNSFANYAYQHYGIVALVTLAMSWGGAAVYYYVINSVKFDRWYHWLAMCGIVCAVTPIVCYFVLSHLLEGTDFWSQIAAFVVYNIIYTALTYVVASFAMRWWSTNCRHTPFPQ